MDGDARLAAYLRARRGLVRLAYRFLGSLAEAEDIVQHAWLRFAGAATVTDPDRYLSRIVANLSLDRLRSAEKRRETYVGPWLPEPIIGQVDPETGDAALDISFYVLSEDCEFVSDGGGKLPAALNIVRGHDAVARLILGLARKNLDLAAMTVEPTTVNGGPGLILREGSGILQVIGFAIDGAGDIAAIYVVRNPDKLAGRLTIKAT